MKKLKIFLSLLILIVLLPTMCSAKKDIFDIPKKISVNDYAKVISNNTKSYIESSNDELFNKIGAKIILVTVESSNGDSINEYTKKIYDSWNINKIGNSNSVFVLFSIQDMQYWVIASDNIKSSLSVDTINEYLIKYTEPDFEKRNFDSAARKTYDIFNDWYSKTYRSAVKVEGGDGGNTKKSIDIVKILATAFKVIAVIILLAIIAVIIFIFVKREIRLRKLANKRKK